MRLKSFILIAIFLFASPLLADTDERKEEKKEEKGSGSN